jgi:hypothetical protein
MLSDIFAGVVFGFLDSLKLIFYICKFRIEGSVDGGGEDSLQRAKELLSRRSITEGSCIHDRI